MAIIFLTVRSAASQEYIKLNKPFSRQKISNESAELSVVKDSTKNTRLKHIKLSGLFLSVGGGLNVPLHEFKNTSIPTFGLMARLEYSSTSIFPFVIGGELNYVSYRGDDQFKSENQLSTFKTKILAFGLTVEYSLSRFFNSAYTIPFIAFDVKTNKITREYDATATLPDYPLTDSKVSIGAGFGFTLFVMDFFLKYNYMKQYSNFGVYTKIKFPVIRF